MSGRAISRCCQFHELNEEGRAGFDLLFRLWQVSLLVKDAQPGPFLLDPNIGKKIFPVGRFAISFDDAQSVVGHDSYVSIVVNSKAVPVLFHGMHLEDSGLKARLNLSLIGRASIDIGLSDVFGVILDDPIYRFGTAP